MVKPAVYTVGSTCLAKVRGYPPWPAIVKDIQPGFNGPRYVLYFCGSKESATLSLQNLYQATDVNLTKFCTESAHKRKFFSEGIQEMLAVRDGEDIKKKNSQETSKTMVDLEVRPGSSSSRRDVEVVDEKVLEGDHTVLEMVQTGKKRKSTELSQPNKQRTTSKRKPSTSGIPKLNPAPKDPYMRVVSSVTPSRRLVQRRSKEQAQASLIVKPVKQKQAPVKQKQAPVKQKKAVKRLNGKGKKIKTPDKVLRVDLARLTSAQQQSTAGPETIKASTYIK
ncbi:hepatoma-derived growth factor-related protein 3 [Eurytemora carolleeae]|uniref:hepatoma-derived growth factor-related protein 3 n=1 Tax=Eurytemora carolleeae TaxID=1294199 RepID=UPI000C78398E|nr:hepatoma-derived growth factor-related protein 3 [Eurytemora carolleeae]|eukprot:XP_023346345.1 hepatoma-derived growth factor-related protein 3-like [Eurytemora affinis]